jgi:hypothetical protein
MTKTVITERRPGYKLLKPLKKTTTDFFPDLVQWFH